MFWQVLASQLWCRMHWHYMGFVEGVLFLQRHSLCFLYRKQKLSGWRSVDMNNTSWYVLGTICRFRDWTITLQERDNGCVCLCTEVVQKEGRRRKTKWGKIQRLLFLIFSHLCMKSSLESYNAAHNTKVPNIFSGVSFFPFRKKEYLISKCCQVVVRE